MKFLNCFRWILITVCLGLVLAPEAADACSVCYGKSDSQLAKAMNWGIFTLLAVVGSVLGGIVAFFVYIAKRSTKVS